MEPDNSRYMISKDEMNLIEFPFALLANRHPVNSSKTLTFSDEIRGPMNAKIIREWIVTGSDIHGLPLSMDEELLLGILYLGHLSKFDGPEVYFIKKQVLDVLKWGTNKQYYNRLEMGLARLKGVSIFASNAFWDNSTKSYTTVGFGIISDFLLKNDGKGRKSNSMSREDMSMVTLDKYIYRSIRSGYIKTLDFSFWVDLETSVSKRLFRYLDKKFYRDNCFEINLDKLCHEKLGLSRSIMYRSSMMQKIESAVNELIKKGYLKKYNLKGNIIQFIRDGAFCKNIVKPDIQRDFFENSSIIGELKALGFDDNSCFSLLKVSAERLRSALNIYYAEKNKRFENGKEAIDNPVGYIRRVFDNMDSRLKISPEKPVMPAESGSNSPDIGEDEEIKAVSIWDSIQDILIRHDREADSPDITQWLNPLEAKRFSNGTLYLKVPNDVYKRYIETTYLSSIFKALRSIDSRYSIQLVT